MPNFDLYRISTERHPGGDALRTLLLILATVLVGVTITASVPDDVWAELSARQAHDLPNWHGNVAAYGSNQ